MFYLSTLLKENMEGRLKMKTKDFKRTKGITLISLIVSIVVLLILAGIAINTLSGENRNTE